MFSRALIVLLLVLNLGVALWWWTRVPAPVAAAPEMPVSGASLEWLPLDAAVPDVAQVQVKTPESEVGDVGDVATVDAQPPTPSDAATASDAATVIAQQVPPRCHALGPFSDRSTADAALAQLRARVPRADLRAVEGRPDRWRVLTPVLADNVAARALATRLTAAGFNDHYLMPGTADAGGSRLALGRFSSAQAARNHQAALRAAGFPDVLVEGEGEATSQYWVDVMIAADTDAAALRRVVGASRANAIDCAVSR
ncbi:SPOR domain-containing protein [Luteimonas sp. RIT-PG2_3]